MNKTVVSPFSSFGKEENGDTIDYLFAKIDELKHSKK